MKKRTIFKLKSLFGGKSKLKRQLHQPTYQGKPVSRSPSPTPASPHPDSYRVLTPSPPPPKHNAPRQPPSPPVPTCPVAPTAPEPPPGPLPLLPCAVCGRTFLPESLPKHTNICEKTAAKKRKTFDSSRQRREGTDLAQYLPKNFGLPESSPFIKKSPPHTAKAPPRKTQSVRNAVTKDITKPTADLSKCPHCSRAFGARAFERHVDWCADKAKILPVAPTNPPAHVAEAKHRLQARTQYKAPPVRSRRSLTRDKASNSRSTSVESTGGRGESPPPPPSHPPPRDSGDYRHHRTRASGVAESVSSTECAEESPHVPVIRRSKRGSVGGDGGDVARARHARLARDLSSNSSKQTKKQCNDVTESQIVPNVSKDGYSDKCRNKIPVKNIKLLEKLNTLASKYNDNNAKDDNTKKHSKKYDKNINVRKSSRETNGKKTTQTPGTTKIPRIQPKNVARTENILPNVKGVNVVCDEKEKNSTEHAKNILKNRSTTATKPTSKLGSESEDLTLPPILKSKFATGIKTVCKMKKEKSISLDSLDTMQDTSVKFQSIGINTEQLSCPCVPCIIHKNSEQKKTPRKSPNESKRNSSKEHVTLETVSSQYEPKQELVELLYKNPSIISSSVMQYPSYCALDDTQHQQSEFDTGVSLSEIAIVNATVVIDDENLIEQESDINDPATDKISGETYTKFTDTFNDAADFNEFMDMTDKLIIENEYTENDVDSEEFLLDLHTPNTESVEDFLSENSIESKVHVSNAEDSNLHRDRAKSIAEFKSQLQEICNDTGHNEEEDTDDTNRKISALEHITIYELHTIESEENKASQYEDQLESENALPSIDESNRVNNYCGKKIRHMNLKIIKRCKMLRNLKKSNNYELHTTVPEVNKASQCEDQFESKCTLPSINENNTVNNNCGKKNRHKNVKSIKQYKMLRDINKSNKEFQTFIVGNNTQESNSDMQSVSSDVPPFKLPRIDTSRINDDYDPFLSAARQMKELMSSDTNIPKKIQSTPKDPTKTLPYLRNNKEKSPPIHYRSDNSKIMKDAYNKNAQKTPALQRMKSFGSSNSDYSSVNTFGGRSSSFRVNRNDNKKSSPNPKLNTTFTKSSKENISTLDKSPFNRSSSLNKSFSSYTSNYSTNKMKEKPVPMTSSLYHSFQRTVKPPTRLEKIVKTPVNKKEFVNLDSILVDDNSSTTDSHYIDPRLINENDNLPINVNNILNNPEMISSIESLLNSDNLPSKFESFKVQDNKYETNNNEQKVHITVDRSQVETITKSATNSLTPTIDDLSMQYDKIMTSLEQSIASKVSVRDDDSLCEDFDLEEFMTSFDEELHKQKTASEKRSYSSTTRVVKTNDRFNSNGTSEFNSISSSPKVVNTNGNGLIPFNKSNSMTFSNNNITEAVFPSSVKRSTSLLDSFQKKNTPQKAEACQKKSKGYKAEEARLEQDIIQSLKEFDKFYESEKVEDWVGSKKENRSYSRRTSNGSDTIKKESRSKLEKKIKSKEDLQSLNNQTTTNGKTSNDSAYSSLNRISPSKLSVCNPKEASIVSERASAGSDSGGSHKETGLRAISSDEFLALERSTELDRQLERPASNMDKDVDAYKIELEKHASCGRGTPSWRSRTDLSSSGSECSLPAAQPPPRLPRSHSSTPTGAGAAPPPPPRLSRFCHECGSKFPVHTAKFCIECGVRRLNV